MTCTLADLMNHEAVPADTYDQVKLDFDTLADEQLLRVNADVDATVNTILDALPQIQALRPQVAQLTTFDLESFDCLEHYALALRHAHASCAVTADCPRHHHQDLANLAAYYRDRLIADARRLVLSGYLPHGLLERLKRGPGREPLAQNLEFLSATLLAAWPQISTKALTPHVDLLAAPRLAAALRAPCAPCQRATSQAAAAAELRRRAFTLAVRTYNEIRQALRYIRRHEGDFETIAPTIYPGKKASARGVQGGHCASRAP